MTVRPLSVEENQLSTESESSTSSAETTLNELTPRGLFEFLEGMHPGSANGIWEITAAVSRLSAKRSLRRREILVIH